MVDGQAESPTLLPVTWTEDEALSTRLCPKVAQYTGQVELAAAIGTGLDTRSAGNREEATECLGRAVQLAHELGNEDQLARLGTIVDVDDAATGKVRLRQDVSAEDELATRTRSTKTVRPRRVEP